MKNTVCWIDVISYVNADESLQTIYDSVRSPGGAVDNLYKAFSLRAHTIKPADDLYRAVLHHSENTLPKWFSELIACYVAILAGCDYALAHHGHNFAYLLADSEKAARILQNLRDDQLDYYGEERDISALRYVKTLCLNPQTITADDVAVLSQHGWSDGEILEITQIVATFSYFVRMINGLGISLQGERIGLY